LEEKAGEIDLNRFDEELFLSFFFGFVNLQVEDSFREFDGDFL